MHFLLTRPENDSQTVAEILRHQGHRVSLAPLLSIDYLDEKITDLTGFQAVLFTSANGVRAFVRQHEDRSLACYAVGEATATEATTAGFQKVVTAGGDVQTLADLVSRSLSPDDGPLLHVSGKDTAGNLSGLLAESGFQVSRAQLYKAVKATALAPDTLDLIRAGTLSHMPFYSPRTAQTFVRLVKAAGVADCLTKITALCLSPAVNDMISCLTWHRIVTAEHPDQRHLFKGIGVMLEENRP
ncbi:MAG: uroporphyrinogen-III synthase [Rhodobacteraceae bacterium]|nr:uroporphyrinogen-III synthase [Paracoccaceae bacterium]